MLRILLRAEAKSPHAATGISKQTNMAGAFGGLSEAFANLLLLIRVIALLLAHCCPQYLIGRDGEAFAYPSSLTAFLTHRGTRRIRTRRVCRLITSDVTQGVAITTPPCRLPTSYVQPHESQVPEKPSARRVTNASPLRASWIPIP